MSAAASLPFDPKRYDFAPYTSRSKEVCPHCQERTRTYSRYIDTYTGELLPDAFGFCDRQESCGYSLSPNDIAFGQKHSYAFQVYLNEKNGTAGLDYAAVRTERKSAPPKPVRTIPRQLVERSQSYYDRNQLARLLRSHLGAAHADEVLARFRIGTSVLYYPGACIFWYIDEQRRVRGGQVVAFGDDWHTSKWRTASGETKRCTSWVHSVLETELSRRGEELPEWLRLYKDGGTPSPCLFGLWQLEAASRHAPVYIVESAKAAVLASAYMPDKIWLAAGGQTYLTLERMAPLKGRKIILYPDSSLSAAPARLNATPDIDGRSGLAKTKAKPAFVEWVERAEMLRGHGFDVRVSDFMQRHTTDEQKAKGYDLADYLVDNYAGYPPSWDQADAPEQSAAPAASEPEQSGRIIKLVPA